MNADKRNHDVPNSIHKIHTETMIPVAQCVTPLDPNVQQTVCRREDYLPIAQCVETLPVHPFKQSNAPAEAQIEVLTDTEESFDAPSALSFVTEENQQANAAVLDDTITGHELLRRLKERRRKQTARSAMVGGVIGFFMLGPIGALGAGVGAAMLTKHRLKRKEKAIRAHLEGRMDHPLRILSRHHQWSTPI